MRSSTRKTPPITGRRLAARLCGYALALSLWTYDLYLFATQLR